MGTDTYYGIDPIFNDTTDYISCNSCGREYDYNDYRSLKCSECESGEYKEEEE